MELPLALPVIVAGVRTATVWTVGTATLSTPVGAPSLGNYIFAGLQTRNSTRSWSAARRRRRWPSVSTGCCGGGERPRRAPARAVVSASSASRCSPPGRGASLGRARAGPRPMRIGAKTFTEQYVLAEVLAETMHSSAGREAEVLTSLGSTVAFDALARGEIDAYVEYTGTLWRHGDAPDRAAGGPRAVLGGGTRAGSGRRTGSAGGALGFENTYAFALRRETAERLRLRSSATCRATPPLSRRGDYEFFSRAEWAGRARLRPGVRRAAGDGSVAALRGGRGGQVDVITAYSSDGRIAPSTSSRSRTSAARSRPTTRSSCRAALARDTPDVMDALASSRARSTCRGCAS